jgi:hypothetical protein
LLYEILELRFSDLFSNILIELHIFASLFPLLASGERTEKVLKQVKHCYRSTTEQDRLQGFFLCSIDCDAARKPDFFSVINKFSEKKARKLLLKILHSLNYKNRISLLSSTVAEKKAGEEFVKTFKLHLTFLCLILFHV